MKATTDRNAPALFAARYSDLLALFCCGVVLALLFLQSFLLSAGLAIMMLLRLAGMTPPAIVQLMAKAWATANILLATAGGVAAHQALHVSAPKHAVEPPLRRGLGRMLEAAGILFFPAVAAWNRSHSNPPQLYALLLCLSACAACYFAIFSAVWLITTRRPRFGSMAGLAAACLALLTLFKAG